VNWRTATKVQRLAQSDPYRFGSRDTRGQSLQQLLQVMPVGWLWALPIQGMIWPLPEPRLP
jgi:hypothetical protein